MSSRPTLRPRPTGRRIGAPAVAAAAGTAVAVAVHAIAPVGAASAWIAAGAGAVGVAVVLASIAIGSRRPVVPWTALAVAVGCSAAAVAFTSRGAPHGGTHRFPGLGEAVWILAMPWVVVGSSAWSAHRRRDADRWHGTDGALVALSVSAIAWLLLVEPYVAGREVPLGATAWLVGLVALDLALAVVAAARLRDARLPAVALVGAGAFVVAAVGHVLVGAWSLGGDGAADSPVWRAGTSVLLAVPLLVGATALLADGSNASPGASRSADGAESSWRRTLLVTVAAAGPVIALAAIDVVSDRSVTSTSIVVVAATSAVVVALAAVRARDIVLTVREATEQRGQARLSAMVEYSNDVVMIIDDHGSVTYVSPGLAGALGYPTGEWVGRSFADVVAEDDRAMALERFWSLIGRRSERTIEFEAMLVRRDGRVRHGSVVMVDLLADEAVRGVVATFRDVTEQRDLERQLSHRAFHDELTGLANRALFLDRMDHALRATRSDAEPVMVLFIDLDDFKEVNDVHGHGVGDETLRSIAARIRSATGPGDTVARLGGDEFAVLLEDSGGIDQAIELAERLLTVLRDPVGGGVSDVVVLASIGIAVAVPGTNTTNLLRDADIAMYEAKRAGKGQIRIFDPAMRRVASRHLAYRSELSNAIVRGQLRVVYLPYVDLETGEARGAEALVRWHHPDHGEISPSEFIPIAERTGLIVPIGRWVLGEALDQAANWSDEADLFLSINLTAVELRQPDLLDHLLFAVRSRGIDPAALMLEVTETDLFEDGERASAVVADLRSHGFSVALDDFGAGYCSISYLQQHPVDMIKIDGAVVAELDRGSSGNTLARAILQLTGSLDVVSAAEGIEAPAQLRALRELGCRLGQGHLLSAPLEAAVIARRFGRTEDAVASGRA